jgi:peptidoglycan/LPS O-acetylase OafA/YrhL
MDAMAGKSIRMPMTAAAATAESSAINAPPVVKRTRIPSLDGLRAVSIALVVAGHARREWHDDFSAAGWFWSIVGNGAFGVTIFFVISGFLITSLLLKERARTGRISLGGFYLRRAFRILPAYYTYIAVIAALTAVGFISATRWDLFHAVTFSWIYNFGAKQSWYLAHSWSLSVEEQFYLLWPVALIVLGPRRAVWLGGALFAISPICRVSLLLAHHGIVRRMLYIVSMARFDVLMCGCVPALLWRSPRFQSLLAGLFAWRLHILGAATILLSTPQMMQIFPIPAYLAGRITLEAVGAALIVTWAINNHRSIAGRVLNFKPITHLGAISYGLYLWQQLFFTQGRSDSMADHFPLNLALALTVASVSYFLIEQPLLRLRMRWFGDRTPAGPGI